MLVLYIILFSLLVLFSAFFSSAETSLLSLNKIRLSHRANKKNKKAMLLKKILKNPDEFFSTILIGNNLVNIAAATISAIVFARFIVSDENLILLFSTLFTTVVILLFAEVLPKSYAFRFSEKLSYLYAYPVKFFTYLFYPIVKAVAFFSIFIFKKRHLKHEKKEFTVEEIKHFLETEIQLFQYSPETLRMVNEIIDVAQKDVKSIMTPRPDIIALEETADIDQLKQILLEKNISKIPIYRENLDHITGIIHANDILAFLLKEDLKKINLRKLATKPIFISEFSPLNYVLDEFKRNKLTIAVVIDEYGTTIGILTLYDIFSEILGGIESNSEQIHKVRHHVYNIEGSMPVEEVNSQLDLELPERKDYTTLSGLFIYYYGRFPGQNCKVKIGNYLLIARQMGRRKIEKITLIVEDSEKP
jgi:putative hemolysin